MVSYKEIQASNALINDATAPRVAVFVGGTSGIGKFTVRALVATGASVRIHLVERKSSEERMHAYIQELHAINPKAEVILLNGESRERSCKLNLVAKNGHTCWTWWQSMNIPAE
jgi:NAD(P)-dependent dehydrogenase (short-subunit alcohol dehydrogenase family)